jgi:hypothetical protein
MRQGIGTEQRRHVEHARCSKRLPELSDTDYVQSIASRILAVLNGRALSFGEILEELGNCDPLVATAALRRLRRAKIVDEERSSCSFRRVGPSQTVEAKESKRTTGYRSGAGNQDLLVLGAGELALIREIKSCLPAPSPIYYQWWFDDRMYPRLSQLVLGFSKPCSELMFVGATTLGVYVSRKHPGPIYVLDVDDFLLQKLAGKTGKNVVMVHYDVFDEIGPRLKCRFEVVYLDPPWYTEIMNQFLIRGAQASALGGHIFISLPPVSTRPGVKEERKQFMALVRAVGLEVIQSWPLGVRYEAPRFEKKAYSSSGLKLDRPWRSGDLFLLKKVSSFDSFSVGDTGRPLSWNQYVIGQTRVFLRADNQNPNKTPSIKPLPGHRGFQLATTSRREVGRSEADLFTSDNRAAVVTGARIIGEILRALEKSPSRARLKRRLVERYPEVVKTLKLILRGADRGRGAGDKRSP